MTPWWTSVSPNQGVPTGFSSSTNSTAIHTKKPSLPHFSGTRADWPEFKAVWRALAESQFSNRMQLAMELKRACSKGKAAEAGKHIYVTSDRAYDEIWSRLSEEYDDPGLCVQSAMNTLLNLKSFDESDLKALIRTIDTIESVFNQLKELGHLDAVHMADIDRVSALLPRNIYMDWIRSYRNLSTSSKMRPFADFMSFLKGEWSALARLAESSLQASKKYKVNRVEKHSVGSHTTKGTDSSKKKCAIHGEKGHSTADCRGFKKLTVQQRYDAARKGHLCFKCFKNHPKSSCSAPVCKCGKEHHPLLCQASQTEQVAESGTHQAEAQEDSPEQQQTTEKAEAGSYLVSNGAMALYPIHCAFISGQTKPITVFTDGGSNASYITEKCASKMKLRKLRNVDLDVSTVGGVQRTYPTSVYEVPLRTQKGKTSTVLAYGMKEITGPLSHLNETVLRELFPEYDVQVLLRPSAVVDLMIGTDCFGLHPKKEVARVGDNRSIMEGELGICLVGTHPELKEQTVMNKDLPRKLNASYSRAGTHFTSVRNHHPAFADPHTFIMGEELGTESTPKCGGCRCGKCPEPGHSLSFREEQELHMIRTNMGYVKDRKHWVTSYPWLVDPSTLPDNYASALATLRSTEKSLSRDSEGAASYRGQIQDMVDRGAAQKLTSEETEHWQGPKFYICHMAFVIWTVSTKKDYPDDSLAR